LATVIAAAFVLMPKAEDVKVNAEFDQFKRNFGKQYSSSEETFRRTVFEENMKKIREHNAQNDNTYEMGVNQFTDMTQEEFAAKILIDLSKMPTLPPSKFVGATYEPVPNAVDWRTKGAVSAVKNQGNCGSCWAFSTTGVLESTYKIAKGTLSSFSEQQLVDCCGKKGFQCQGCSGAWPEWALNYVNSAGIESESQYPYKGVEGACNAAGGQKILNPSKPWSMLASGDTNALKSALNASPVSVCVDASNWGAYKSGVFSNCGKNLNHAVLAVGYADDGSWLVKNSWGTSWGEQGYIRLAAGDTCGVANHVVISNIA